MRHILLELEDKIEAEIDSFINEFIAVCTGVFFDMNTAFYGNICSIY